MGKCEKADREGDKRKKRDRGRRLLFLVAAGLTVAAIVQELNKPAPERSWTGRVGGVVPYDLRWPLTADRVQAAMWNPDSHAVLTPQPFGVGWSVNLARVLQIAQDAVEPSRR